MSFFRPTWIEVSRSAYASNVRTARRFLGDNVRLLAVLKADGYGHGAAALAPVAIENGATMIGVSSLEEGISLRAAGISAPVLILGSIFPLENFNEALKHNLIPTVASLESAQAFAHAATRAGRPGDFHLKIDTGMGRIGVSPAGAAPIFDWLKDQRSVRLTGVYSHFASADSDAPFTQEQIERFESVARAVRAAGFADTLLHIANSAAAFSLKGSHFQMARLGLSLYGASLTPLPSGVSLEPVLSWHSKIVFLKKMPKGASVSYGRTHTISADADIATLPVGYADGVPRRASNRGFVLVKGRRAPIVGRVTMDQIMIDVTGFKIDVGEPVILIGSQGSDRITVDDWAKWGETISYEIFCGLSKRVPRVVIS